jgi:hypothetical protein
MHKAMATWRWLWEMGYIPTCPHWTGFQDLLTPMPYEQWLEYDNCTLPLHHAILREGGMSSGADSEVDQGVALGMFIFRSREELLAKLPPETDPATLPYQPKG